VPIGFAVEADSDADAIEKAKAAAKTAMESAAHPEHRRSASGVKVSSSSSTASQRMAPML
jgi:hypothetical protein